MHYILTHTLIFSNFCQCGGCVVQSCGFPVGLSAFSFVYVYIYINMYILGGPKGSFSFFRTVAVVALSCP